MVQAPAAALTNDELTLYGIPGFIHFTTRGLATGIIATGALQALCLRLVSRGA